MTYFHIFRFCEIPLTTKKLQHKKRNQNKFFFQMFYHAEMSLQSELELTIKICTA